MDIGNWVLETADGEKETIPEGTILHPGAYYVYSPPYQWLDNSNEAITLITFVSYDTWFMIEYR